MLRTVSASAICVLILSGCFSNSSANAESPDFENEVLLVLTKAGCNSGACHGAAVGRGGFRLSLYGQNPDADWIEITRSLGGRRIDTVRPENSLLLRKAGEFIEHGGGQRLIEGDHDWRTVANWIARGGLRQQNLDRPKLTGIVINPSRATVSKVGEQLQIEVSAQFADGKQQPLTELAILQPQDADAIQLENESGLLKLRRPGRHVLLARVRDLVATCEIIVPTKAALADNHYQVHAPHADASQLSGSSLIDRHIDQRLTELGLESAGRADDATLLRRLYLDLTGQLPPVDRIREFVWDKNEHKVDDLIEELSNSEQAITKWTHWLATELQMQTVVRQDADNTRATAIFSRLRLFVENQQPMTELFSQMVEAEGSLVNNPNVGFYLLANDGRKQAEQFAELFMGVQLACANCHNHPLDRWTQDDYHGLAAIFAGIRRGESISWKPGATNMHPATGSAATMQLPDGRTLKGDQDPRPILADWIKGPGEAQINRAWLNRIWSELFGSGLVNPVDDLRASNPATHSELFDNIAEDWKANGGGIMWMVRQIVSTDAYQRASINVRSELTPEQNLSVAAYGVRKPKPLRPEILLDIYSQATDVWNPIGSYPAGTRAISVLSANQADRRAKTENACTMGSCEADLADTLSGKLSMIAGPIINDRIAAPNGRVSQWIADENRNEDQLIESIYLHLFSRFPTRQETEQWTEVLSQVDNRHDAIEDIVWSMLTSSQFVLNN